MTPVPPKRRQIRASATDTPSIPDGLPTTTRGQLQARSRTLLQLERPYPPSSFHHCPMCNAAAHVLDVSVEAAGVAIVARCERCGQEWCENSAFAV